GRPVRRHSDDRGAERFGELDVLLQRVGVVRLDPPGRLLWRFHVDGIPFGRRGARRCGKPPYSTEDPDCPCARPATQRTSATRIAASERGEDDIVTQALETLRDPLCGSRPPSAEASADDDARAPPEHPMKDVVDAPAEAHTDDRVD